MPRSLVRQGANLTWLGIRAPEIRGTTTAAELHEQIQAYALKNGFEGEIQSTNIAGEAITKIDVAYNCLAKHRRAGRSYFFWLSFMQASRRSSAALVKVHIFPSRSDLPVSTVMARSTGPVTAIQACPAASP
jgi:3-dehydroquinate dehydratase